MYEKDLIIAVDGPSSSGKSTFAKEIARELGYTYIDSGAMYRAVAYFCLENGIIQNDQINRRKLFAALPDIRIDFIYDEKNRQFQTILNNKNIENKIRTTEISDWASDVSKIREVRKKLVDIQRAMGARKRIVMDGRDIGTVVFPDAELKIFLIADVSERARRRHKELVEKGILSDLGRIEESLKQRDVNDGSRAISPLRRAEDAVVLDNSKMTMKDQMIRIRNILKSL